jgi:PAS domain S-box-containing protein
MTAASTDRRPAILLVDDRPENLVALEAVLAPLECRLVKATSGAEALKRLLDDDFAVILLDVQMPELDGFETAEYIKRRERTRTIPIIFVTAISKEEHHVFRGYEAGAVDYVFKPYDPVVLRSKVAVFVELWRAAGALRTSEEIARASFEDAPIGMARMDREGRILTCNRALCETLGLPPSKVTGLTLEELTHRDDRGEDDGVRDLLLNGKRPRYEVERRLVGAGGRALPVLVSFAVAHPDGGEPTLLAHVQDLRERKRAERARDLLIREQAARLEAEAVSKRLRAIQRIVDAAMAPLPLDQMLGELLGRIAEVLEVDGASFVLVDDDDDDGYVLVQAAEGVSAAVRAALHPHPDGPVARVLADRVPCILEDVAQNESLGEALPGAAVSSVLAVPLHLENRAIGVLTVGTLFQRSFSDADTNLLQLAADRAANAIERGRLFEREHRIAQELQKALLPAGVPSVVGLSLAARYLPGGAGTEVGGDWYDALELPGGRLALVMGDVAGRGVAAAASMGRLRSAWQAYALEDSGPAGILDRLNRFQLRVDEDSMATVVALVLDVQNRRLTWANAGHPPPLVLVPGGPRYLEHRAGGVPLGAIEDPSYVEEEAKLPPGSTLILYTDGLVERPGRPLAEGFDRLRAAIPAGALDPEDLCEAILGGTLGGATSNDDVTFLVARVDMSLGARLSLSLPGEMEGLARLRATLRRWLSDNAAEPDEVAAVTMATNEAVENAIEHGHRLSTAPFVVELAVDGGQVVITVKDRGRWREARRNASHRAEHGDVERGRGLTLMRAFMDDVEVIRATAGTTVVLRRRLRSAAPVSPVGVGSAPGERAD